MKRELRRICFGLSVSLLLVRTAHAQGSQSVICQFERIATAELDSGGKIVSGGDSSTGEVVISNLQSSSPVASGNHGSAALQVLKRSKDTLWLAEITADEVAGFITLFLKKGIVMYTKHETLHTLSGAEEPFGFVEIGRCRGLK